MDQSLLNLQALTTKLTIPLRCIEMVIKSKELVMTLFLAFVIEPWLTNGLRLKMQTVSLCLAVLLDRKVCLLEVPLVLLWHPLLSILRNTKSVKVRLVLLSALMVSGIT